VSDERTSRRIVEDTNELARVFLRRLGHVVPDDYLPHRHIDDSPRAALVWQMAVDATEFFRGDEVSDALEEVLEDERALT
jgi:chemotaxis methyl-accepting protein methylase